MNEMIEKVAKAMCVAEGIDPNILCYSYMPQKISNGLYVAPHEQICYPAWTFNIKAATAAIAAMREPTEGMREALNNVDKDIMSIVEWYQVLIDAALKE